MKLTVLADIEVSEIQKLTDTWRQKYKVIFTDVKLFEFLKPTQPLHWRASEWAREKEIDMFVQNICNIIHMDNFTGGYILASSCQLKYMHPEFTESRILSKYCGLGSVMRPRPYFWLLGINTVHGEPWAQPCSLWLRRYSLHALGVKIHTVAPQWYTTMTPHDANRNGHLAGVNERTPSNSYYNSYHDACTSSL